MTPAQVFVVQRNDWLDNEWNLVAVCDSREAVDIAIARDRADYIDMGLSSEEEFDKYHTYEFYRMHVTTAPQLGEVT